MQETTSSDKNASLDDSTNEASEQQKTSLISLSKKHSCKICKILLMVAIIVLGALFFRAVSSPDTLLTWKSSARERFVLPSKINLGSLFRNTPTPVANPTISPQAGGLVCTSGVVVAREDALVGNEEEMVEGIRGIKNDLGIRIVWQVFGEKSTESDWIAFFTQAKQEGVKVIAAVTDSDYVPQPCNQQNQLRCDLDVMGKFLTSVRNNPNIYKDTLYGFLLIDEPYKDISAEQVRWMYEDAKAIIDVPIMVGWSREIWKFDKNPKARFTDGMCDICLISALEFRDYGEGKFFDKDTLIDNQTYSRKTIRERDPDAKIISSIQVFGSSRGGSTYYMPSPQELQEMVDILFSEDLQSAGKLDGVVWQTYKAITGNKGDFQDNLSDPEFEEQRQIAREVCSQSGVLQR